MADIRQTVKFANYLENIGWKIEKTGKTYSFIKKVPFLGSVVKIQRPEEIDIGALKYVRKKHNPFQIIIEPKSKEHGSLISKHGFRLGRSPYLPTKTLHLDLTKPKETLFEQLKKDARYSLRKTKDLNIYAVHKTQAFRQSWKEAVDWKHWVPPQGHLDALIKSFGKDSLFLVTPGGDAGAIFLSSKDTVYYWQAFSNEKGRKTLAQYKILWAGITWAKKRGAKTFDFEGIYDERFPNKKWKGFTHFKKSFGGYEVKYPGVFVKYSIPKLYYNQ